MSLRGSSPTSSADEALKDELPRAVEREIQENARAISCPQPSWPGFCTSSPSILVRGVTRRVFGVSTSSSTRSSPTRRSPPRSPRREQASSDITGKSGSAPRVPARTGSEEEARPEKDRATLTRSDHSVMMRSALVNIQEDAEGQDQAPFAKMEEAMTGLTELAYRKAELPNPPELPCEFPTRWPHDDSVDGLYHRWFYPHKNICPITNETLPHSSTAPNHHCRDMISAWRLDHMAHSSASNADTLCVPVAPSEEQIQDILHKFSGHSIMQEQALHEIQILSKITKGEQPCLHKWPGLLPELIDLQKNWKSTWTRSLNEKLVTIILNLSVHRPNREILGGQKMLPDALMHVVKMDERLGSSASCFAKVASVVAILSEFDGFRKSILDIGGIEMLWNLLKMEDPVVRKEAITAIHGLCRDQEGKKNAESYNVPDALLECLMVSDEALLLLDCLHKDPCVVDKMCDKAMDLVNIIMAEQGTGSVTPEVTYCAISLVYTISQKDASKMQGLSNLDSFKGRLLELSCRRMPSDMQLMVEKIIKTLKTQPPKRSYWDNSKLRKIRPLQGHEQSFSGFFFKDYCESIFKGKCPPKPPYVMAFDEIESFHVHKQSHSGGDRSVGMAPLFLCCPLSSKIMVDPVAISSGKTFERSSIERWFKEHNQVCPITGDVVSQEIHPNERVKCYLEEWNDAVRYAKSKLGKRGSQR